MKNKNAFGPPTRHMISIYLDNEFNGIFHLSRLTTQCEFHCDKYTCACFARTIYQVIVNTQIFVYAPLRCINMYFLIFARICRNQNFNNMARNITTGARERLIQQSNYTLSFVNPTRDSKGTSE